MGENSIPSDLKKVKYVKYVGQGWEIYDEHTNKPYRNLIEFYDEVSEVNDNIRELDAYMNSLKKQGNTLVSDFYGKKTVEFELV